jgi:membrane associated rhomboid family serine protease
MNHRHDRYYNSLGASGGVSAILFSFILFDPWQKIYLYGIIGIPAVVAGAAYLGYSWHMDRKGGGHINHGAHFWGAVFGVLFTVVLKPGVLLMFFEKLISLQSQPF